MLLPYFLHLFSLVAGFSKITNFNATALGMKNMTNLKFFPNYLFLNLAIFGAILIEFISPLIIVGNIFNYTSNNLAKLSSYCAHHIYIFCYFDLSFPYTSRSEKLFYEKYCYYWRSYVILLTIIINL